MEGPMHKPQMQFLYRSLSSPRYSSPEQAPEPEKAESQKGGKAPTGREKADGHASSGRGETYQKTGGASEAIAARRCQAGA